MIRAYLPPRPADIWGEGHFGAPRGSRTHAGVDYACFPGSRILPVYPGHVTRLGYPYGSGQGAAGTENPFRYVEITDVDGYQARYFYIDPQVREGEHVSQQTVIGVSQSLQIRYPSITDHVHVEVRTPGGELINPEEWG